MPEKDKDVVDAEIVEAKKVKKSLARRFIGAIFVSSPREVRDRVIHEALIPDFSDMLANALHKAVDAFLYEGRDGRRYKSSNRYLSAAKTSYDKYYNKKGSENDVPDSYKQSKTGAGYPNDMVGCASREKARYVITRLGEMLEEAGEGGTVSVYDLYSCAGLTGDHADHNWGWDSVEGFSERRVNDRDHPWHVFAPRPSRLD